VNDSFNDSGNGPEDEMSMSYNWSETPDDKALLERIGAYLRAPERVGEDFSVRVMERIRVIAIEPGQVNNPAPVQSWWTRPRILTLSPLAGLAMAASIAVVVALGTLAAASLTDGNRPAVAANTVVNSPGPNSRMVDTVHLVRFVLMAPGAKSVSLVGDFNAWVKGATALEQTGREGVWVASVVVPSGRHEYAFVVDGNRWVSDPAAPVKIDEYDVESSILSVGSEATQTLE
jgi:Glycogen recognition site of AMP-activated protein kinase